MSSRVMPGSELRSSGLSDPCQEGILSTNTGLLRYLRRKRAEPDENGANDQKRAAESVRPGATKLEEEEGISQAYCCPSHWTLWSESHSCMLRNNFLSTTGCSYSFRDDCKYKISGLWRKGETQDRSRVFFGFFLQIGENLLKFISREGRKWWRREEIYDKGKETIDVTKPWRRQ